MAARLKIIIDAAKIASQFKTMAAEVQSDIQKAVKTLATNTHAHVADSANRSLRSQQKLYTENLSWNEVSEGVFVVTLGEKAMWIEEGASPGDMKENLLKKGTKTSAEGYRYKSIPFDHGKAPSQQTTFGKNLRETIQKEFAKNKVMFSPGLHDIKNTKKFEVDKNGSPRVGKLHSFNLGGPIPGKGNTPALDRVTVYQSLQHSTNEKTGHVSTAVRRDILTFRTVTDNPKTQGKWFHPGYKAKKFMDDAYSWAMSEWETVILPEIIKKWSK